MGLSQRLVSAALRDEMWALLSLAWPLAMTFILSFLSQFLTMINVGRVSAQHLAAAALGNMFANASGTALIMGLGTSIDTLASQAVGARNLERVGQVTSRGVAVMLLLALPVAAIWYRADVVLGHLGQDAETAQLASSYCAMLIVGLPPQIMYEALKKHLLAINIATPPLIAQCIAIFVAGVLGFVLVQHSALGYLGAPLANCVGQWCMLAFAAAYLRYHRCMHATVAPAVVWWQRSVQPAVSAVAGRCMRRASRGEKEEAVQAERELAGAPPAAVELGSIDTNGVHVDGGLVAMEVKAATAASAAVEAVDIAVDIHATIDATLVGLSWRGAFAGWPEFMKLGAPSALMLMVEWGSFEVAAVISGFSGTASLAAHTVIATTASLAFMPILGIAVAGGIRIGQCMGERAVPAAVRVYHALLALGACYVLFNAVVVLAVQRVWGGLFTDDEEVLAMLRRLLWLLVIYTAFDAWQCAASGALRGLGRPDIAAVANVGAYLIIGLPAAFGLSIPAGMHLAGVWVGFIIAVAAASIFLSFALTRLDWNRASQIAYARATGTALEPAAAGGVGSSKGDVGVGAAGVSAVAGSSDAAAAAPPGGDADFAAELRVLEGGHGGLASEADGNRSITAALER